MIYFTSDGISLEDSLIVRSRPSGSGNNSVHKRTFVERSPECVELFGGLGYQLFGKGG